MSLLLAGMAKGLLSKIQGSGVGKDLLSKVANKNPGKGLFGGKLKGLISNKLGGGSAPSEDASKGAVGTTPKAGTEPSFLERNALALGLSGLGVVGIIVIAVSAGGKDKGKKSYRR